MYESFSSFNKKKHLLDLPYVVGVVSDNILVSSVITYGGKTFVVTGYLLPSDYQKSDLFSYKRNRELLPTTTVTFTSVLPITFYQQFRGKYVLKVTTDVPNIA